MFRCCANYKVVNKVCGRAVVQNRLRWIKRMCQVNNLCVEPNESHSRVFAQAFKMMCFVYVVLFFFRPLFGMVLCFVALRLPFNCTLLHTAVDTILTPAWSIGWGVYSLRCCCCCFFVHCFAVDRLCVMICTLSCILQSHVTWNYDS